MRKNATIYRRGLIYVPVHVGLPITIPMARPEANLRPDQRAGAPPRGGVCGGRGARAGLRVWGVGPAVVGPGRRAAAARGSDRRANDV